MNFSPPPFPSPSSSPFNWVQLLAPLGLTGVLYASQQLLALGVVWMAWRGWLPGVGPHQEGGMILYALPIAVLGGHGITALGLWWMLRRVGGDMALTREAFSWPVVAGGVALGVLLHLAGGGLSLFFPPPENLPNTLYNYIFQGGSVLLVVFVVVFSAPLLEEVLFRGVLFSALRKYRGFFPTALFTTALFSLMHLPQTAGYWPSMLAIFVAGFILAWLRERTGKLWFPLALHMGFNATALVFLQGMFS